MAVIFAFIRVVPGRAGGVEKKMKMAYNPRASMPGKPTNAGYTQTTLASGKGEGFVQPEFLGPSRKAAATRTRNRTRVSWL